MENLAKMVQRVYPYVVTAIVVPGGTFIALAAYLLKRHRESDALDASDIEIHLRR